VLLAGFPAIAAHLVAAEGHGGLGAPVRELPQALAAVDLALWDAAGRRAGRPLAAMLTDAPRRDVPVNATVGATDRAAALQAHPLTVGARIVLHPTDAQAVGLAADTVAKVDNGVGTATLPVAISDRVAPGCVWIESGYGATAPLATAGRVEVRRA